MSGSRTPLDKIAIALRMLLEGSSARSVERIMGVSHQAILEWMVQAGEQCQDFLSYAIYQLEVADIQIDEVWSFVHCKQKTADRKGYDGSVGDAYCFVAIERTSKVVVAFRVAKRDPESAEDFANQLRVATSGKFQISSDGFGPYSSTIPDALGYGINYGQVIKEYANPKESERRSYSPGSIIRAKRKVICGTPDQSRICTSHIERHNLSTRMSVRRMTRLTNAHSKRWENHVAMLALWFAYYNYCRVHSTLKTTPAVAAGIASEPWTIERLLVEIAKVEREFATIH